MNFSSLLSIGASGLALVLSLVLIGYGFSNKGQQNKWQDQQQELMNHQQKLGTLQQQAQMQQQQIQAGKQLAEQVGPAVLKEIAAASVKNKDEKLKSLLSHYGVSIQEATPAPAATPGLRAPTP